MASLLLRLPRRNYTYPIIFPFTTRPMPGSAVSTLPSHAYQVPEDRNRTIQGKADSMAAES